MNWKLAEDIWKRIRRLRVYHGWSQSELAKRIGINKSVIGYYEVGGRFPTCENLIKLSEVFAVSVDYILKGDKLEPSGMENLTDTQINAIRIIVAELQEKNKP